MITSEQLNVLIVAYESWMGDARRIFKLAATQSQKAEIGDDISEDIRSLQRGLHFVRDIVRDKEIAQQAETGEGSRA